MSAARPPAAEADEPGCNPGGRAEPRDGHFPEPTVLCKAVVMFSGQTGAPSRAGRWARMATGAATLALLAAACGSGSASPPTGTDSATSLPVTKAPSVGGPVRTWNGIIGQGLAVTAGHTYLAWNHKGWKYSQPNLLSVLDPQTGGLYATVQLAGAFHQALEAGGSLWVAETTRQGALLERRNPNTLALLGTEPVDVGPSGFAPSIATASGSLWVAGGKTLTRLALPDGGMAASYPIAGQAGSSSLGHDPAETELVVGWASPGGVGGVQLRSGRTGSVIAQSTQPFYGVATPFVSDIVDQVMWVSEPTGNMGYVESVQLPSVEARHSTIVEGSNGIRAWVLSGVLWISQQGGGPGQNYCGDPLTGRPWASFYGDLGATGHLGGLGGVYFYVFGTASDGTGIAQFAIPSSCRPATLTGESVSA